MNEAMVMQQGQPRILAALSASEMAQTQKQLVAFCQRKIQALRVEYKDAQANFNHAKAAKWRTAPFETAMRKAKKAIIYYGKMWAAVKAGYVIVPNFDAEVMAVRTNRECPIQKTSEYMSGVQRVHADASLPAGRGRYVDDEHRVTDASYHEPDPAHPGLRKKVNVFETGEYGEIDFPISVVKPIVMDATQRAMALRIFDRIEVAGARRKDPIVLGRLMKDKWTIGATFFIAWWIDVETL